MRVRTNINWKESGLATLHYGVKSDITVTSHPAGGGSPTVSGPIDYSPDHTNFVGYAPGYIESSSYMDDTVHSKDELALYMRQAARWSRLTPEQREGRTPPIIMGEVFHAQTKRLTSGVSSINWRADRDHTVWTWPLGTEGPLVETNVKTKGTVSYTPSSRLFASMHPGVEYDPLNARGKAPDGIALARRNAMAEVLPKIGEGFTLPLFIKEWSDVPGLFRSALKLLRWLKNCANYGLWSLCSKLWTNGSNLRRDADMHLAVQFGLLPLISDLKKIVLTCLKLRKQIARFLSEAGKFQIVHCQEALRPQTYVVGHGVSDAGFDFQEDVFGIHLWNPRDPFLNLSSSQAVEWSTHIEPQSAKYHLTCFYIYFLPYANWLSGLMSVFDAFGVNFAPSQIWAAIPFSFVVDWIFDVGSVVERFDKKNVEVLVNCLATCESVKYKWFQHVNSPTYKWRLNSGDYYLDNIAPEGSDDLTGGYAGTVYRRWVSNTFPIDQTAPGFRMPRGMQLLSASSLLIQLATK